MENLDELKVSIGAIKDEIVNGVKELASSKALYEFKKTFLDSKAGKINALMKEMKNIPNEMKAEFGKNVNELKNWAGEKFDQLDEEMKKAE